MRPMCRNGVVRQRSSVVFFRSAGAGQRNIARGDDVGSLRRKLPGVICAIRNLLSYIQRVSSHIGGTG